MSTIFPSRLAHLINKYFILLAVLQLVWLVKAAVRNLSDESLTSRQRVIIIADPGVDDAAAILMAVAHPDIDVLAVVSNFGVVSSTEAADNARIILNVVTAATYPEARKKASRVYDGLEKYIPVYVGSDFAYGGLPEPSKGGAKGRNFHGEEGLGDFSIYHGISSINYTTHVMGSRQCNQSDCSASSTLLTLRKVTTKIPEIQEPEHPHRTNRDIERRVSGVEFLISACKAHPGEISILILSPATTLATAVAVFPSLPDFIKRVYIMGGALRVPGNISPLAEFNFGNDAAAAALVVVAFTNKLTILPLDATMKCLLSKSDLEVLHSKSGAVGKWFAGDLAPFYMKAYKTYNSVDMPLHDAHTVGAFIRPDLYSGRTTIVEVQVLVSADARVNGMLFEETVKKVVEQNKKTETNPSFEDNSSSLTQGPRVTGMVEVVLGVDRDGFVDLFIALLSSLP